MRLAGAWVIATISIITTIIAGRHEQGNSNALNASYTFVCAEVDNRRRGGGKKYRRTETSRRVLRKGREIITPAWSGHIGQSRVHKAMYRGPARNEGAETWRNTPTTAERPGPLHEHTFNQSSPAHKVSLGFQHNQLQLPYGPPPLEHMGLLKDFDRAVDGNNGLYTREIKRIGGIDVPAWLEDPASLIGTQRSPEERPDHTSTRVHRKHEAVYNQQRFSKEHNELRDLDFQDTYGPGSRQHQERTAHPSGMEIYGKAFSGSDQYPSRTKISPRQIPAALERRSQPKQQQRGARERNPVMLTTAHGENHLFTIQGQSTATARRSSLTPEIRSEEDTFSPIKHFLPSCKENNWNPKSFMCGVSSKKQVLPRTDLKAAATKDSLYDVPVHSRAERRSYRKRDGLNAVGSNVATSNLTGGVPSLKKKKPVFQHNIHTNELSPAHDVAAGESNPMLKSVLDLGVDDMQVLADLLYDSKATYYANRLEEGGKRKEVQEGMFFSKLNRIQERQKLQRRESELNDEKKLKALEESLRLTKPLSAYHDALLQGGTHKRARKNGPGIRFYKDSAYTERNRLPGEIIHEKEGRTARKGPKKNGKWRENRQKQMMALALIEREELGEEGSEWVSRFRRRKARGTEEELAEERAYLNAGSRNSDHTSDSIFSAWEYVAASPHNGDEPLPVVDDEDVHGSVQTRKKRVVGSAPAKIKETDARHNDHENMEATTSTDTYVGLWEKQVASAAEVQRRGKNAHVEAREGAAARLHTNDTRKKHTGKTGEDAETAKGSETIGYFEDAHLHSFDLTSTASGVLPAREFSSVGVVGVVTEKPIGEILSAVIEDDGGQKVLAEKVSDDGLRAYQGQSRPKAAQSERLREGFAVTPARKHIAHGDSSEEVSNGESAAVQVKSNGLQKNDTIPTLPLDNTSQRSENPSIDGKYVVDPDDEMAKTENRDIAYDSPHPSSDIGTADENETPLNANQLTNLQDEDMTTEGGGEEGEDDFVEENTESEIPPSVQGESLEEGEKEEEKSPENETVNDTAPTKLAHHNTNAPKDDTHSIVPPPIRSGSLDESKKEKGEPSEDETVNETVSATLANYFISVPEEDTLLGDRNSAPILPKSSSLDVFTKRTADLESQEFYAGGTHMFKDASTSWETPESTVEPETFREEEFFQQKFGEPAVVPSDTYALRGSAGLAAEEPRSYGMPPIFNRRSDPYTDGPTSPIDISHLSRSRLSRFRARHFRNDAAEDLKPSGKHTEWFSDEDHQSKKVDRAHRAVPLGQRDSYNFPYRRLQFTSNKKSVLDRNTSARLEFVDNDHGSQFVNWRSIDGERMIEKLWINSMEEAERRQRKQVQREIKSAFANEFDAVRTKKQLLQALGVSTAVDEENEQQLAQRFYNAMQAVLHGPEEEVLTGQAFGRYVPSSNQAFLTDIRNRIIYGPWSVNWNRAINSRTQRVSVGSRRGAVSVGSSASSYVTTVNVNWGRVAVTFAARPNDQAVKLGVLRGRYGVDVARSNRLRTSAVETVMRYVESATVVDQINRTYGQRIRVRRFSINYTRDFTLPSFDSPGRTPGLRQELGVNWGTVGISVGTDVPDSEYAISVGLRGYQFSVLRDFFQRLIQVQGNWGRGWQFELSAKTEDPISPLIFYQFGFGRLGRLYSTAGAGVGGDNTPMAIFQVQGDRSSVAFKALEQAGVRIFNIGFTVGRFTYSWDSVVNYDQIALPLSPISPILKALLHLTP